MGKTIAPYGAWASPITIEDAASTGDPFFGYTIVDFDARTDRGFGFSFEPYDAWQLFGTVVRAVETYRHSATWARLVRRAMCEDVSWARSAEQYAVLYRSAMAGRRGHRSGGPTTLLGRSS